MTDTPVARFESSLVRAGVTLRQVLIWAAIAVGGCMLLLTAWCALRVHQSERVMPAVRFEGLDVSGLTRADLLARIELWGRQRSHKKIAASLAGKALLFDPQTIALQLDREASARRVLGAGRADGLFQRSFVLIKRGFSAQSVSAELTFDPKLWHSLADHWDESAIADAPFQGGIAIAGTTVTPLYPRPGTRLDRRRAQQQLSDAFRAGSDAGALATHQEAPRVGPAEVERVAALSRDMLSGDVELVSADGTRRVHFTPTQLGSVLRVVPDATGDRLIGECAADAVHLLLDPHRSEVEQAPRNARFVIDSNDRVQIEAGRAALILNDAAVADALCAAARSQRRTANLPLESGLEPTFSSEAAEHAGVVRLVGSFSTRHACCQPRVQNIHQIADLLDGTLVRPGETFSLNQLVGPRTLENGFRPAPSIEDGDMIDTVGGGVSQFATTLFNALFYAGYDILERQPHSYWFTRYPMGYDATLSYPHPDIVFKNDTEACALIKTRYTDRSITVKIYGNNGGRQVRATVSERQNIVSPPIELIPNPRLDPDEERTREGGMIGWTVSVKRTITFADGKIREERRKVTYKPRARRVEVHPCRIPAGQPGHTGEHCPIPEKDAATGPSSASDAGSK